MNIVYHLAPKSKYGQQSALGRQMRVPKNAGQNRLQYSGISTSESLKDGSALPQNDMTLAVQK